MKPLCGDMTGAIDINQASKGQLQLPHLECLKFTGDPNKPSPGRFMGKDYSIKELRQKLNKFVNHHISNFAVKVDSKSLDIIVKEEKQLQIAILFTKRKSTGKLYKILSSL